MRAERRRLVDGTLVVVDGTLTVGFVGCGKHPAAAEIGDAHAVVAHDARGFIQAGFRHLIAPGCDGRDAERRAGLDRLSQVVLLPHGGEIDRETVQVHRDPRSGGAGDGQHLCHSSCRKVGIAQHARLIGKPEQLGKMDHRARALLAADHREVIL